MLLKHSLTYAIIQIFPAIVTLTAMSIFTRILTPEEYGVYSFVIMVAAGVTTIFYQWMSLSLGRFYLELKSSLLGEMLSTIFLSFVIIGFIIFLLCFLLSKLLGGTQCFYIAVTAIAGAWFELNQRVANADLKPKAYALMLTIKSTLALVLGYVAINLEFGAEGVIISLCVSFFISTLVGFGCWRVIRIKSFSSSILSKMLNYGLPLTMTFLLLFIINGSGKFFLKNILGDEAVGHFSVAFDLTQYVMVTICSVLHLASFPLILKAYNEHGLESCKLQLVKSFDILILLSIPLVMGFNSTLPEIVNIFIGEKFRASALHFIPILSFAFFLMVIKSYYFDYAFQLANNTKLQIYGVLVGAVVCIILTPTLIFFYDVIGACYAILLSFFAYLLVCVFLGKKIFDMPKIKYLDFIKVVLSSVVMYFVIVNIALDNVVLSLLVKVFFGILVFSVSLVIFNYKNYRYKVRSVL